MSNKGTYKGQHYQFHMKDAKGNVVIVTDYTIIYLDGSDKMTVIWTIELSNYERAEVLEGGIWIHMKQAGSASLKEFVGGGVTKRFIPGGDRFTVDKFYHQLDRVLADRNMKLPEKKSSIIGKRIQTTPRKLLSN